MNIKNKQISDSALVLCFAGVLTTGVMLHLKRHGIIIEPRPIIKVIHYSIGFAMTFLGALHCYQCWKPFKAISSTKKHTAIVAQLLLAMIVTVVATGAAKLWLPFKIANLGLVHYWLGMIMSAVALLHLRRMLPLLLRKIER